MIKINKFLAVSAVTLSLVAGDMVPYSSMAVYADQTAKVVCDERYWVAARSGPGTEYELEHKLSNGKDITILEQTTGSDGKQITRSVSAISGLILYQQEKQLQSRKQKLRQMLQQVLQSRQASSRMMTARMTSSRIMRIRLHLQRLQEHMPQELLQVVMYMSAMRQAHPAPQRLFLSTGTIRLI